MMESRNDTVISTSTGTFYIRKIQTFPRRCWLNITINTQNLTDMICTFLICISNLAVGLTYSLVLKIYTQVYALFYTVMFMMMSMYMFQILNNMKHKLGNISWWWWFSGQNTGHNFKNNSFLEQETFKPVWEMARYLC